MPAASFISAVRRANACSPSPIGPSVPGSAVCESGSLWKIPHMSRTIRIAAAADIHCSASTVGALDRSFQAVQDQADLILLAGDLTTYGEPEQAELLAGICRGIETPIVAVLGNQDWHSDRCEE